MGLGGGGGLWGAGIWGAGQFGGAASPRSRLGLHPEHPPSPPTPSPCANVPPLPSSNVTPPFPPSFPHTSGFFLGRPRPLFSAASFSPLEASGGLGLAPASLILPCGCGEEERGEKKGEEGRSALSPTAGGRGGEREGGRGEGGGGRGSDSTGPRGMSGASLGSARPWWGGEGEPLLWGGREVMVRDGGKGWGGGDGEG